MSMSRKHYQAVAEIVREVKAGEHASPWLALEERFAKLFAADCPLFDAGRFHIACQNDVEEVPQLLRVRVHPDDLEPHTEDDQAAWVLARRDEWVDGTVWIRLPPRAD